MEIVEVADKYRITITRPVRKTVPMKVGQKVAVVPFGERILIQPLHARIEHGTAERKRQKNQKKS